MTDKEVQMMLSESNEKLRVLFRKYRRKELRNKQGVVLIVDDMLEQQKILEEMAKVGSSSIKVKSVESVYDAKSVIRKLGINGIKIVIIDICLNGEYDGFQLIEWMSKHYPDVPYIVITGRLEKVDELKDRFPGADILIKGQSTINDYADAMGLPQDAGCNMIFPSDKRFDTVSSI